MVGSFAENIDLSIVGSFKHPGGSGLDFGSVLAVLAGGSR